MTKVTSFSVSISAGLVLGAAAWTMGCQDSPRVDTGSVSVASQRAAVSLHGSPPPDGPTLDSNWEYEMTSGRLSKLPVSHLWTGQFSAAGVTPCRRGEARVRVRARCLDAKAAPDECDPGLVVAHRDATTAAVIDVSYDADSGPGRDAELRFALCSSEHHDYEVFAYSELRGTSHIAVEYSLDDGASWSSRFVKDVSGADVHAGGALVKVGAMGSDDTLAVHSRGNCEIPTRMLVFTRNAPDYAHVDPPWGTECDPSFTATPWTKNDDVYALVGLDSGAPREKRSDGNTFLDYEQYVDLVHARATPAVEETVPLRPCEAPNDTLLVLPAVCSGEPATLPPGKYLFSVMADAGKYPVGSTPDWTGDHRLGDDTGHRCNGNARGVGNGLAFRMTLLQDGLPVRERWVPRGALGGGPGVASRIGIDYAVPADGTSHTMAIVIDKVGPHVNLDSSWRYFLVHDTVEVKLATLNIEYGAGMQIREEMKNAVDLLGRSTDSNAPNLPRVAYKDNRGRFRWDADVLSFNEIHKRRSFGPMLSRLEQASSLAWAGVYAEQKSEPFDSRYGFVFVNERTAHADGIEYGRSELDPSWWPSWAEFYALVAQAAARGIDSSGGYDELPFMVYNTYLHHDDEPGDHIDRRESQYETLIDNIVKYHLPERPRAFNRNGNPEPDDPDNRFVILGDLNMQNHQCAESNRFVRLLRDRFGYAVDVSMAATDAQDRTELSLPGVQYRTFDLHYNGASIKDRDAGSYGPCAPPWTVMSLNGSANNCPYGWETYEQWLNARATDAGAYDADRAYMWWAGTSSVHGGGGSRLDTIILVGRGWANDDPVREYAVMQNKPQTTPMFPDDTAAEIRRYCVHDDKHPDDATERVCAGDGTCAQRSRNYSPEFKVCENEVTDPTNPAGAGHTAFRSDHKPVGVRLRVLMNPSFAKR